MSLNVGELIAYLRMDMRTFEDGVARAQTMADKLDGKDVDVKVKADTAVAEEKLAAVAASEDKVDEGNKLMAWGSPNVTSWYKNEAGRVTQNWPFALVDYWRATLKPNPDDFVLKEPVTA